ncbi:major facilitator superfamily transporter [Grosmannia clavigera kw1407]|uniref:Major facilitator superfamily transporter n=1 Tax=Grosmannia clavigera (strain kw1407 / UAMH 11150) TaxID=655863 RepID=F0XL94_GROCL|nr:major facilitator superfamily transporter [Grosmannia clavigera kw1407]EFX01474.1 major facilitator superfamily transporter [Grosmannia clavigera kw1407]
MSAAMEPLQRKTTVTVVPETQASQDIPPEDGKDGRSDLAKTLSKTAMAEAIVRIRTTPFDPEKDVPSSVASPASTLFLPAEEGPEPAAETGPTATSMPALSVQRQLAITGCIIMSSFVQYMSNFLTLGAGYWFADKLVGDASPAGSIWMVSAYSLTQSSVVLIGGRLGTIYGHQRLLLAGLALMTIMSLANGFCTHYIAFVIVRAFTGLGGGLLMPNAVALIAVTVPPGRNRNISMGFFGAAAPVGGWIGGLVAGLFIRYSTWPWLFYFMAIVTFAVFSALVLLLPKNEEIFDEGGKIDYIGAVLGLGGLAVFNIVWTQAPSVGWQQASEIVLLILSVALFAGFILWEHRFASDPIMPLSIFRAPTFSALICVNLLTYMSFGISLWYLIAWQQLIRGLSVLDFVVHWLPFCLSALAAVGIAAFLIPRLAAQYIMAIGIVAVMASNLLLATMPVRQSYWAQTFVGTLLSGVCPDFVYVAAQIIASNSVSRHQQGLAGSLIGTLNLYGNSLGLGPAGTIQSQVAKHSGDLASYRAALYFGVGLAAIALVVDLAYVRMPRDRREGWSDSDKEVLRDAAAAAAASAPASDTRV